MKKLTMKEIKKMCAEKGYHWFDKDTMKWWKCRIEVYPNMFNLFITSTDNWQGGRCYNVHQFDPVNVKVNTLHSQLDTLAAAKELMKEETKKLKEQMKDINN